MATALGRLWARITGGPGWDREVQALRNTLDDDTPAPGDLPGHPTPQSGGLVRSRSPEEPEHGYNEWRGEDPGH
jgi:hypothetical protein